MKSTSDRGPALRPGEPAGCGRIRARRGMAALWSMLAVAGVLAGGPATAEEAATARPGATASYPERGARMQAVEARYGAPAERRGPVGKPPITRWDYPGFVVFFEYDRVIHSVVLTPAG